MSLKQPNLPEAEELQFHGFPAEKTIRMEEMKMLVSLADTRIETVSGLDKPFSVDIIMENDIIDVCINDQRCIVNRLPEKKGNSIWFYAKHGKVMFKNLKIYPTIHPE